MALLIKGGRVVTATDAYDADIYCADETITTIGADLDPRDMAPDVLLPCSKIHELWTPKASKCGPLKKSLMS